MINAAVSATPHLSFSTTIDHPFACVLMWFAGLFVLTQAAMGKASNYGWRSKDPIERALMTAFAIGLIVRGIATWVIGSVNVISLFIAYTSFAWQGYALGLMMVRSYRERREKLAAEAELHRALDTDAHAVAAYGGGRR